MRNRKIILLLGILFTSAIALAEFPTTVLHQGQLTDSGGSPLDTVVSITFTLYDEVGGGNIWTETHPTVTVSNGLYNVLLGSIVPLSTSISDVASIDGGALGVQVGSDSEMSPHIPLSSVFYAYRVHSVNGASGGTLSSGVNVLGSLRAGSSFLSPGEHSMQLGVSNRAAGTNSSVLGGRNNNARGDYSVVAGGGGELSSDSNSASGNYSIVGGGRSNYTTNYGSVVVGGENNRATNVWSFVGGGGNFTVESGNEAAGQASGVVSGQSNIASGTFSFIGGGQFNAVSGISGVIAGGKNNLVTTSYSTIGGGYENEVTGFQSTVCGGKSNFARGDYSFIGGGGVGTSFVDSNSVHGEWGVITGGRKNYVSADYGFIGGGRQNRAIDTLATVGGGQGNTASSDSSVVGGGGGNTAFGRSSTVGGGRNNSTSANYATIAGGNNNSATFTGGTVSGGQSNTSSHTYSTVCGGNLNVASGPYSIVVGGLTNTASGQYAFAGGHDANASHYNSFVWSSSGAATNSFADHSVTMRAQGGSNFLTGFGGTGAQLPSGATAWSALSDSTMKIDRERADTKVVLSKLAAMNIDIWRYKHQPDGPLHMGPMAQDLYAAFGLGDNNTTISTIDADGVLFAAVQELAKQNEQKDAKIENLEGRIQLLESALLQFGNLKQTDKQ